MNWLVLAQFMKLFIFMFLNNSPFPSFILILLFLTMCPVEGGSSLDVFTADLLWDITGMGFFKTRVVVNVLIIKLQ